MVKHRADGSRTLPSWTGTGTLEIGTGRERTTVTETVLVLLAVLAVDISGFVFSALLTAQTRIVCGLDCFNAPQAILHDARVHLWIGGVIAVITVGGVLLLRRVRLVVAIVQLGLFAALLGYTVPIIDHAHAQQRALQRCEYGRRLPCVGVRNLGTPTGT